MLHSTPSDSLQQQQQAPHSQPPPSSQSSYRTRSSSHSTRRASHGGGAASLAAPLPSQPQQAPPPAHNNLTSTHSYHSTGTHHSSHSQQNPPPHNSTSAGLGITSSFQKGLARWTKRMSGTIASCGAISQLPSEDHSESGAGGLIHSHHSETFGTLPSELSHQSSLSSASSASVQSSHQQQQKQQPRKHFRRTSSSTSHHKNSHSHSHHQVLASSATDGSSSSQVQQRPGGSSSSSRSLNKTHSVQQQQQQSRQPSSTSNMTSSQQQPQTHPMPERPPRKQYSSSMNKKGGNSHHHQHHKSVGKSQDQDVTDLHDHHTLSTATTAAETISYSTDQGDASIASEVGMEVVMSVPSHDHQDDHAPNTGTVTASTSMPMHTTASDTEPALMHEENTTRSFMAQRRLSSGAAARTNKPTLGSSYQSHSFPAGKHIFTVDRRYSMLRVIGSGAYGVVISATDSKTSNHKKNNTNNNNTTANNTTSTSNVAIKMVPKAFSDEIDAKRILREIKLLKHFRHDNIVRILDMMPPNVPYLEDFHDVYMVTDLMETDLHRIIYSKQKLSTDHAQYFIYQVLRGLKYIHSCKVLHRDLKPSNLLVNSNCDLKICDFGLARGVHQSSSGTDSPDGTQDKKDTMLLTEYVVTRWYRAPEIMLACHEYSYPIDVWSVGCIFAELLSRKPMFPGEDYIDQLTIISEKLGKLADADLDFVTSDKAKRFMRKLPSKAPPHFALVFPGTPPEALDSLRRMLEIHPHKRISVQAALQHPFFEPLHNPADEPVSSRPFDFGFEKGPGRLQRLKLQELIWKEVVDFRPHDALPVAQSRRQPGATAAPTTTATTAAAKV